MADPKPADKKPPSKPAPAKPSNLLREIFVGAVLVGIIMLGSFLYTAPSDSPIMRQIQSIISTMKLISTIISMIALSIAIYAFIRINEMMKEETKKVGLAINWDTERKQKNTRWERVDHYMTSLNPSDWKIAILEADNILDEIVERLGYKGDTLGERMKAIEPSDFPYLEEAWAAHKFRNELAHRGMDVPLARSDAERTINVYHRVFKGLGYL
jgi:hypothetical protein